MQQGGGGDSTETARPTSPAWSSGVSNTAWPSDTLSSSTKETVLSVRVTVTQDKRSSLLPPAHPLPYYSTSIFSSSCTIHRWSTNSGLTDEASRER
ncbi:hypothetical protein ElyMa_005467700 [Elysia marginata]|uniref:Uncharacterized protein n=1 Tax=Elysia marginata TaxID=1093978 RepID=A0AAV4EPX3_9GAST|nr:hypothetical protein ElyMa_005467700 [Elysia marginata]